MKKLFTLFILLNLSAAVSQEHFGGASTSKRVGLTNIANNPSELANLSSKLEIQLMGTSTNIANNKIGFKDLTSGSNLKTLAFKETEAINFNFDSEIYGPSAAIKLLGFGFALTTKANIKADLINVDPRLADALSNGGANSILALTKISNGGNQRMNATVWGEVGLSAAHRIYKSANHKINAGVTLKLLFPGAYANVGIGNFNGEVTNTLGVLQMRNTTANVNIAYAGNLANSFTDVNDYTKSLYGGLNGMSGDVGVDYQFKPDGKDYRLKVGAAIKNYGSMTYKADNNQTADYSLSIQGLQSLNLNQFEDVESLKEIEQILINNNNSGAINFRSNTKSKDYKVNLPTVFNLYADLKIISKLNLTVFAVQKVNQNNGNDQIATYNSMTITPRVNIALFEAFLPITTHEVSGTNTGLGFRFGGFYIGSNSAITALTSNAKQIDFYTGFRFGIL